MNHCSAFKGATRSRIGQSHSEVNAFRDRRMFRISCRFRFWLLRVLAILFCAFILVYIYLDSQPEPEAVRIARKCYLHNGRNPNGTGRWITYFEDLLTSVRQPRFDEGVFFLDTNCSDTGIARLKPR